MSYPVPMLLCTALSTHLKLGASAHAENGCEQLTLHPIVHREVAFCNCQYQKWNEQLHNTCLIANSRNKSRYFYPDLCLGALPKYTEEYKCPTKITQSSSFPVKQFLLFYSLWIP